MSQNLRCPLCGPITGGTRPPLLNPNHRAHQLNIALVKVDGEGLPSARRVFTQLMPEVSARLADGELHEAWFMRKPPGIRLRLSGPGAAGVRKWGLCTLARLREQGVVASAFASIYEPETFGLGGPAAVPAMHRWFTADSLGWWQWNHTETEGRATVADAVLTLAIVNDLCFRATANATSEVWDVWRNLHALREASEVEQIPALRLEDLRALGVDATLIDHYLEANVQLATDLNRLWSEGRLELGMRALLVKAVMFHWNRFGLEPTTRRRLCAAMDRALGPRATLRSLYV